jgi:hypothetical protein
MLWIDRVRSLRYQNAKVATRARLKARVLIWSGTPRLSVRLSVIKAPTTLMANTVSQESHGA